jgi:hypothetical protein
LERFARLVGDGLRFKEQVRAKGSHFDAVAPERGSNFFVARAEGGLVEAVPADRGRAGTRRWREMAAFFLYPQITQISQIEIGGIGEIGG